MQFWSSVAKSGARWLEWWSVLLFSAGGTQARPLWCGNINKSTTHMRPLQTAGLSFKFRLNHPLHRRVATLFRNTGGYTRNVGGDHNIRKSRFHSMVSAVSSHAKKKKKKNTLYVYNPDIRTLCRRSRRIGVKHQCHNKKLLNILTWGCLVKGKGKSPRASTVTIYRTFRCKL